jgi:pyocin large subunit-like protein
VPFTAMVCGEVGEMVSAVTMRGEVESLHAAVNNPANATATMTRAMRVR